MSNVTLYALPPSFMSMIAASNAFCAYANDLYFAQSSVLYALSHLPVKSSSMNSATLLSLLATFVEFKRSVYANALVLATFPPESKRAYAKTSPGRLATYAIAAASSALVTTTSSKIALHVLVTHDELCKHASEHASGIAVTLYDNLANADLIPVATFDDACT